MGNLPWKLHFWPFWPIRWPQRVTPWPLLTTFLSCVVAKYYWPPVSVHTMSIFTLLAVQDMICWQFWPFWPFWPHLGPSCATPWPLFIMQWLKLVAVSDLGLVSAHSYTIGAFSSFKSAHFFTKKAFLAILPHLVTSMCDPMTPHDQFLQRLILPSVPAQDPVKISTVFSFFFIFFL